jgi:hypothetical protein
MAWPNLIDQTTVGGGAWLASLPANNIKNNRLSKVARSSNALITSTILNLDLGASPVSVGCIALVVHNLSTSAKVRIRGDDAADFATPIYDSGWIDVWPAGVIPQELLEWEDDNFWLGTISQNAIAGYRAPYTHYLPAAQTLRYWRIEMDDTGNTDGWLQVGRVFIGKVWAPAYNMKYGVTFGYTDATVSETSLTGEEFFDVRSRTREHKFELGFLSKEEAFSHVLAMQQQLGTSGEMLISQDRDDAANVPRTCFLGRMKSISPITSPNCNIWTTSFEIKEIL